jgi:hypothetical protein
MRKSLFKCSTKQNYHRLLLNKSHRRFYHDSHVRVNRYKECSDRIDVKNFYAVHNIMQTIIRKLLEKSFLDLFYKLILWLLLRYLNFFVSFSHLISFQEKESFWWFFNLNFICGLSKNFSKLKKLIVKFFVEHCNSCWKP